MLRNDAKIWDEVLDAFEGSVAFYHLDDDEACRPLYVSKMTGLLNGITSKEYLERYGKDSRASIYSSDLPLVMDTIKNVLEDGKPRTVSFRIYGNGDDVLLWANGLYFRKKESEDGRVFGAVFSISSHYGLEVRILEKTPVGVHVIDAETWELSYTNKAGLTLFGKDGKVDYKGKKCYELLLGRDSPCAACAGGRFLKGHPPVDMDIPATGKIISCQAEEIVWHERNMVVEYLVDVTTERMQQRLVEDMVDHVPGGVCLFRWKDGILQPLILSKNFQMVRGEGSYERFKLQNDLIFPQVHPDDRLKVKKAILMGVSKSEIECVYRLQIRDNDHAWKWIHLQANVFSQKDGSLLAYANFTDITQAREQDRALVVARADAKAKSDFLVRMSHEIRTPLNGVVGFSALAMEEDDPKKQKEYLDDIRISASNLSQLLDNLFDLSLCGEDGFVLHNEAYSCGDFERNVRKMAEPYVEDKHIDFVITFANTPDSFMVDKRRFDQIFSNLVSNAMKFTPKGGMVSLLVKGDGLGEKKVVRFILTDNGIGMSEEFQTRMFEPFAQENGRVVSDIQGIGLGLGIAKTLTELLDGTMLLESEKGKGTTVTLTFRLSSGEARKDRPWETDMLLKGKHVLVVEDHPLNRLIAERAIERMKGSVTVAENGRQAVDIFAKSDMGEFDAILMDIRMPVMDGVEAAKAIRGMERKDARTVPIIAMTANALEEEKEKGMAAGMNAYLSKPVEPVRLCKVLVEFIRQSGKA